MTLVRAHRSQDISLWAGMLLRELASDPTLHFPDPRTKGQTAILYFAATGHASARLAFFLLELLGRTPVGSRQ